MHRPPPSGNIQSPNGFVCSVCPFCAIFSSPLGFDKMHIILRKGLKNMQKNKTDCCRGECHCGSHDHHHHNEHHNHEHCHSHGCCCDEEHSEKSELLQIAFGFAAAAVAFTLEHTLNEKYSLIYILVYIAAYFISGFSVIKSSIKHMARGKIFDEMFLMTVASLGALAIGKFTEGIAVMLLYRIGEFLQDKAVENSEKSITALLDIRPEYANVKTKEGIKKVSPEEVRIGDIIVVKPGESVPLDGIVISGSTALDASALTGEAEPQDISAGDEVLSGCVVINGAVELEVTGEYEDSAVAKIIEMAEHASEKKALTETFITRFAAVYTPVVTFTALVVAFLPPLFFGEFKEWLYRGLIFLVLSCPCALVISVPLTFFGGIGGASKQGLLIRGANVFDALARAKTVVFDKTGTLTKGEFKVTEIVADGISETELLELAGMAEVLSNHPVADAVTKKYREVFGKAPEAADTEDYKEIAGRGVSLKTGSGIVTVGNAKLMLENGITVPGIYDKTVLYVAKDGKYLGYIALNDILREDSKALGKRLKENGINNVIILSGDKQAVCDEIAAKVGADKALGELLPGDKAGYIEKLMEKSGGSVIFAGDGINDAPALALSDVGVSMGGVGSAAASQASDVILMTDKPSLVLKAVLVARKTLKIARENIIFALSVKLIVLLLGIFGIANMWFAVFADVGVCFIAVLNSLRMLKK